MSGLPPVLVGAAHESATCWLPRVPASEVGAAGTPNGTYAGEAVENVPTDPLMTLATRKMYEVPLVRPVTVAEVLVVPVLLVNRVHVEPEFVECSMAYPEGAAGD